MKISPIHLLLIFLLFPDKNNEIPAISAKFIIFSRFIQSILGGMRLKGINKENLILTAT